MENVGAPAGSATSLESRRRQTAGVRGRIISDSHESPLQDGATVDRLTILPSERLTTEVTAGQAAYLHGSRPASSVIGTVS